MVLPNVPQRVTQRGNRRERTFFEDDDYALYLDLLAEAGERHGAEIWSYCLMPNHVHGHYTGYVNAWRRMTEHLHAAFRYVALNLVNHLVGQGFGLIHDSKSARTVVQEFKEDFVDAVERMNMLLAE
jgi:REP element-mobilizing transposase RayT